MKVDMVAREPEELNTTSVALLRLLLLASLCTAIVFAAWLLWLGSAHERTPWYVGAVFPVFTLTAASQCFRTAAKLGGSQRKAWRFFGTGCLSIAVGELMWASHDLFLGIALPASVPMDAFYLGFPICFILGSWHYRIRTPSTDDAFIQIGNLGIIFSATLLMYIFANVDFLSGSIPSYFADITVLHGTFNVSASLFALIVLWLHGWGRRRQVTSLIFIGLCFNALDNFMFIGALMGDGYQVSSLSSGSILVCASFIIWAAFEQRHMKDENTAHGSSAESQALAKQWESLLPPLAFAGVLAVALVQRDRLVANLIPYVTIASLVFISALAMRNWWGHRLESRLRVKALRSQSALEGINHELATQNVELRTIQLKLEESQDRLALHREQLEVLVAERTRELETSRQALHRSDRLASLGTLAAGLAHELNNPLGIMQLQADDALILRDKANSENALRGIVEQLRRCAEIVRSVLRFSRDETSQKRAVELADVLLRSVKLADHYATRSNVKIECQIESGLDCAGDLGASTVWGNAIELEQVIVNLLRNAIEASESGSRVAVELSRVGELLRLRVIDKGAGMTDETREHAFDPFYTTRRDEGGTGLGLSVAHGIMEQHGGSLQVHSHEGKGATVTMEIARHEEA
ncbi:MAG: HAMP domain-containing histidine kinase [Myxococcales bacterium]|nr:HAMP domain-containing histidine kinase [Myxococcales bacterium]